MKKSIFFVMLIALSSIVFFYVNSYSKKPAIPIAIMVPVSHTSLEVIEKTFKETIMEACPGKYRFDTYNAQGNLTLMHSQVEEILQKNYALVFTEGFMASQMMSERSHKKDSAQSIVFTCVPEAFVPGILTTEAQVTGIAEIIDLEKEVACALTILPTAAQFLLVYDPRSAAMVEEKNKLPAILKEHNVALATVEVFAANELMTKVPPFMNATDLVIILKDNTVVAGLPALIKVCEHYKKGLFASDLDSPDSGAAFGFGVREAEFGIEGAKKALEILEGHKEARQIEVSALTSFCFKVNAQAAQDQGISEDAIERALMLEKSLCSQ